MTATQASSSEASLVLISTGTVCRGASAETQRRQDADLLEDLEEVQLVPVLDEHAVRDPPDVDAPHLHRPAAGGDAQKVAGGGAAVHEAADDPVARDDEVLQGGAEVGQAGEEGGPELPVGLAAVRDDRVVVDVVLRGQPVDEVRVVRVDDLVVGLWVVL